MRKLVTVHAWLLVFVLMTFWVCGMVVGYSVGIARADTCSGWNGRFIQSTTCDGYQCTGVSFGPFWTNNCTYTAPPVYPPDPAAP